MSKDPDSSLNPLSQPKRGAPFGPTGQHLPQRPAFDRGTEGAVGARLGPGGPESSKSGAAAALDSCSSACLESKIGSPSYSIALAPCQFCLEAVRKHRRTPIRPVQCDSMVRYGTSPGSISGLAPQIAGKSVVDAAPCSVPRVRSLVLRLAPRAAAHPPMLGPALFVQSSRKTPQEAAD